MDGMICHSPGQRAIVAATLHEHRAGGRYSWSGRATRMLARDANFVKHRAAVPADLASILSLEVPLIVVIAQRDMPVREVINLAPGAILELPKAADEDLEVLVNNKPIGAGRAVKVGEHFGVRITYVGDVDQRIDAMRGEDREATPRAASAEPPAAAPSPAIAAPV